MWQKTTRALLLAVLLAWPIVVMGQVLAAVYPGYNMGSSTIRTQYYVNAATGNDDSNPGTSRDRPFRTVAAAWARIPPQRTAAGGGTGIIGSSHTRGSLVEFIPAVGHAQSKSIYQGNRCRCFHSIFPGGLPL